MYVILKIFGIMNSLYVSKSRLIIC